MSWVKLDDQYPDHPKIVDVGPLGMALHVAATCYCARYLTDGFVPAKVINRLINFDGISITESNGVSNAVTNISVTEQLTRAGLLEKVDGGYQVHDYLEYNPTGEQVRAERERNKDRQKQYRDRNGVSNGVSNGIINDAPSPSPSLINELLLLEGEQKRPEIFSIYEHEMGAITPMIADKLEDMEKEYSLEWITAAFKECALNNKRNVKYACAILDRWKVDGFLSERKPTPARGGNNNGKSAEQRREELIRETAREFVRNNPIS